MFTHEFQKLTQLLSEKYPELVVFDTICGATKERQSDLVELVKEGAEAIVVIGGKHSANTRKLAKLASSLIVRLFMWKPQRISILRH